MKKVFAITACLLLFASNTLADINNAPIVAVQRWQDQEIDALGPFFSYHFSPKHKLWALRPIFSYESTPDSTSWDIFYPIIRYHRDQNGKRFSFFPIIQDKKNYHEFFPFFWGKTEQGEKYGGFFPIYGIFKQRYDRDNIKFILWPLYIHSSKEKTQFYHFIWPFFTFIKGSNRKGFKFLPLYGYDVKKGVFERHYFLWPIFIWTKEKLDTDHPQSYFAFFPLYIKQTSPQMRSYTYLWPFFRYYRYKSYRHYDFLWPLWGYSRGDKVKEISFLPLFKTHTEPHLKSVFLFYPLYKHQVQKDKHLTITTDYFLIIDRYEQRYRKGQPIYKLAKLWPLYYYCYDQGKIKRYFPAILPIEDPGFERTLAPILRIYYHYHDPQGNSYTNLLWGLYSHRKQATKETWHLFPLVTVERSKNYNKLSLLAGIFQKVCMAQKRQIRLFYLLKFSY